MIRKLLLFIPVLMAAGLIGSQASAQADNAWTRCRDTAASPTTFNEPAVKRTDCYKFEFDSNTTVNTTKVFYASDRVRVCIDPDIAATTSDTAEIMISSCLDGYVADDNHCTETLTSRLDGTPGPDGTQKTCDVYDRGKYMITWKVAAVTEDGVITVQGIE